MNTLLKSLAALAIVAVVHPAFACPNDNPASNGTCESCQPKITRDRVNHDLSRLIRTEGLANAAQPAFVLQPINLDGDPGTEEAMVTVFAPELCGPAMLCPTIIVAERCGSLVSVGNGTGLVVMQDRTNGWFNLGETLPSPIPLYRPVVRTLRWNGLRYVR